MTSEHSTILGSRTLHWPDESHCAAFAAALAARPAIHDAYLELRGPLGAGKTSFARHLLRALGVAGRIKSPSYAVLEPYRVGGRTMSHLDFYRFADPREWDDAGLRDVFAAPGLKLAEWPEHAAGHLPRPDLRLEIAVAADGARRVRAEALSERGEALLA
jgi:tRNA threonylcarbamoyladenosine biosynthesis protein TsaE